jgi:hypothetical protein
MYVSSRYQKQRAGDLHKTGSALLYESALKPQTPAVFFAPVGLVLDRGLGAPQWGDYLDCYGHGRCTGLSGNFECEIHRIAPAVPPCQIPLFIVYVCMYVCMYLFYI